MSTLQTSEPLSHTSMHASNHQLRELARSVAVGDMTLDAPYQRGSVWTVDQQRLLFRSLLTGVPVPAIIVNHRDHQEVGADEPFDAVIDGKQRLLAAISWFRGELDLPASWIDPDWVATSHETTDGPYVNIDDLTDVGRRRFANRCLIPVAEARLSSVEEEAEVFVLVNRAGTAMSDSDFETARSMTRRTGRA